MERIEPQQRHILGHEKSTSLSNGRTGQTKEGHEAQENPRMTKELSLRNGTLLAPGELTVRIQVDVVYAIDG